MKSTFALLALSTLIAASSAFAAPSPSHPSPAAAAGMMNLPNSPDADLTQKGKVVSAIDANEYTYIEVAQSGGKTMWIAGPKTAVKKDNVVRFEDGAVMSNFRSKLLNRTFPSVMFVNKVVVTNEKK